MGAVTGNVPGIGAYTPKKGMLEPAPPVITRFIDCVGGWMSNFPTWGLGTSGRVRETRGVTE